MLPRKESYALCAVDCNLVIVFRVELNPILVLENASVDNHVDDGAFCRLVQPVPKRDCLHLTEGILGAKSHDVLAV